MTRYRAMIAVAAALVAPCNFASAQEATSAYPSRPVTIIIPITPGGSFDVSARMYAQKLSDGLQQPFVLDFKPGAGGTIGAAYVAKSTPNGYTIILVSPSFTTATLQYKDLPYDPLKSFAPISLVSSAPYVLVVTPSLAAKSVTEYIAYAKANPGKLNIGTTGAGAFNHLAAEWLHIATNTKATFIHYKSSPVYLTDLISGRIQGGISGIPFVKGQVAAGKIRALGVTSIARNPAYPDVPSFAEQGVAGYDAVNWFGFVAPAQTPAPIINKLSGELVRALKQPDVLSTLGNDGAQPIGSTPAQFGQFLANDLARWRKLVQDGDIKLEE